MNIFTNLSSNPRVSRLVVQGAGVLTNRFGRPPTDVELLNVRRKAAIWARYEASIPKPKAEALENTGIRVALPEEKLQNRFVLPSDNVYMIAPKGDHPHPKGLTQVVDDSAINTMVANFRRQTADPSFPGLLVDYDHVSQNGKTEAAGWITNLLAKPDGLYANIKWTNTGKEAVEGGEYRLVSPVWKRSDCEDLGDKRCRPTVLDSLGLTNEPNMKGLRPLSKPV